jgi:hypothetical protein
VVNPAFDAGAESRRYLVAVLDQAAPVPWLTEFRGVLDQRHPTRVDDRSAEVAARQARDLRGLDDEADTDSASGDPAAHDATEEAH